MAKVKHVSHVFYSLRASPADYSFFSSILKKVVLLLMRGASAEYQFDPH